MLSAKDSISNWFLFKEVCKYKWAGCKDYVGETTKNLKTDFWGIVFPSLTRLPLGFKLRSKKSSINGSAPCGYTYRAEL